MKIERILVPTDFSRKALTALDYAIAIAREHESEIVLAHVIEPLPRGVGRWMDPAGLIERYLEEAQGQMTHLERYAIRQYPRCRGEIHFGVVDKVVADLVRELEADVVVIPVVHRGTGFLQMLFGGVADKLLHRAPCPVLTVPVGPAHDENRRRPEEVQHHERHGDQHKSGMPSLLFAS